RGSGRSTCDAATASCQSATNRAARSDARGLAAVLGGGDARPALERVVEGALLGEPEEIGDLRAGDVAVRQVRLRRPEPLRVEQVIEEDALVPEASLQRARAHRQFPGDRLEPRIAPAKLG